MNMKTSWVAVLAAAGLLAAGAGLSRTVGAPTADRSTRIAVINVARVANEMKEKQDIESRLSADGQRVMAEQKQRTDKIRDLESQLGNFRPDSAQYDDLQRKRATAVADYKSWTELVKFDQDLTKKRATMMLDDKISAAVAEYASKNGIDIVVSNVAVNVTPREFDGVSFEQLMNVLRQRPVVYAAKGSDISDDIIVLLDSKYRAEGAVGAAGTGGQNPGGQGGGPTGASPSGSNPANGGPTTGGNTGGATPAGSGQRRPTNK